MDDNFLISTNKLLNKNMIGHAYLVSAGMNYDRKYLIEFIKKIVNEFTISFKEKKMISDQIDNGTFSDITYIMPDGQWIKKEQIINLQEEFKTKSVFNEKRFYIIEFAEDLNRSAYNTLLKFLEEPENDVVAFLVTKNVNLVAETIISRCQKLNLIKETTNNVVYDLEKIEFAYKYLDVLLKKKKNSIPYLCELYKLKSDQLVEILQIWLSILYDQINNSTNVISNDVDFKIQVINKYSKNIIISFINKIDNIISISGKNYNNRLLMDKLVISMFGVDYNV